MNTPVKPKDLYRLEECKTLQWQFLFAATAQINNKEGKELC